MQVALAGCSISDIRLHRFDVTLPGLSEAPGEIQGPWETWPANVASCVVPVGLGCRLSCSTARVDAALNQGASSLGIS